MSTERITLELTPDGETCHQALDRLRFLDLAVKDEAGKKVGQADNFRVEGGKVLCDAVLTVGPPRKVTMVGGLLASAVKGLEKKAEPEAVAGPPPGKKTP